MLYFRINRSNIHYTETILVSMRLVLVLGLVGSGLIPLCGCHIIPLMLFHLVDDLMSSIEVFRIVFFQSVGMHKVYHSAPRLGYLPIGYIPPCLFACISRFFILTGVRHTIAFTIIDQLKVTHVICIQTAKLNGRQKIVVKYLAIGKLVQRFNFPSS